MVVVFLNHDFVLGIAHRTDFDTILVDIADTQRCLGAMPICVHPDLPLQETGVGPLVAWANHQSKNNANADKANVELLLRLCHGPWVTELEVDTLPRPNDAEPSLPNDVEWRKEAVLHLGHHALAAPHVRPWILTYDPKSTLPESSYRITRDDVVITIENFRQHSATLARHLSIASQGLHGALAVLERVTQHSDRIAILDNARNSARRWVLDCTEQTLFQALITLDVYAEALDKGFSRELAAEQYSKACSVPMSQESGAVYKNPTCRKQREFMVPGHGKQYFDMHAKPGGLTRIHIWTEKVDGRTRVYVGHCGDHLLLPGMKK